MLLVIFMVETTEMHHKNLTKYSGRTYFETDEERAAEYM
jgi:hypothetical protein